ncbi:hypothetical protein BSPA14S_K0026 (plasmid) [Borreliella spielmanii A14S]|uniref:Uncharacterized protein n=1 Tax=Borreliella spielmanii A14S TaxID=498742 RepID=C0RBT6_9SPIR|nr:hypothetical protein BSPA14S_K0026 [Borreliella spielmanii A14S]
MNNCLIMLILSSFKIVSNTCFLDLISITFSTDFSDPF